MITFTCPTCGEVRTAQRRRCYPCTVRQSPESRERIRQSLTGVRHDDARRKANSDAQRRRTDSNRFDVSSLSKGRPAYNRKPVGSTRVSNGHTQVKCEDGKWRYRSRVVWAEANGPIPRGRLIHHINENPHDDRLENLQMVTVAEHMRIHMLTNDKAKRLGAKGLASRYGKT